MSPAARTIEMELRDAGWRGIPTPLDAAELAALLELQDAGIASRPYAAFDPERGLHKRVRLAAAVAA